MFARIAVRKFIASAAKTQNFKVVIPAIRSFSAAHATHVVDESLPKDIQALVDSHEVVIPELVDTLEWVLDSPPNVHQFEEPPIVVEIEHLDNLIVPEH